MPSTVISAIAGVIPPSTSIKTARNFILIIMKGSIRRKRIAGG
jgi:hypothetical protein